MGKALKLLLVLLLLPATAGASELYPLPAYWSLAGIASWGQPLIASGAALPPVASAAQGDRFIVFDAASWTEYLLLSGAWAPQNASGTTSSGTTDHAALSNLAFADSAHTGFASEAAVVAVAADLATVTASLSADIAEMATVTASLTAHIGDSIDPHGASPTFSIGITIGSGTPDAFIEALGTGVARISSYTLIPSETATPPEVVGTLWTDGNQSPPQLKFYDGTSWHAMP